MPDPRALVLAELKLDLDQMESLRQPKGLIAAVSKRSEKVDTQILVQVRIIEPE